MDTFDIIKMAVMAISFATAIISLCCTIKTKNRYEKLAIKLGNGYDITKILDKYIQQVNELNEKDKQIIEYCNNINNESLKSIKKMGLVKFDAFGNTKNKLSFALCLLNKENSGIIFSSIYGEDYSNIYIKKIEKGKAKNNLSQEEDEALEEAINNYV